MKLLGKLTAVVLSAAMLLTAGVSNAGAATVGEPLVFQASPGTVTVITDTNGRQTVHDGALDVSQSENSAAIADVASYELRCQGKSVLEVTLNNIQSSDAVAASSTQLNGYYAVDINNLAGNQSAFITGLSPSNVQAVQNGLIDACEKNTTFDLESLDFIDAEKTGDVDKDLYLCWAAASANILTYTGWAQAAGFKNEDDMFEAFVDNFDNNGSNLLYAMAWFINGVNGIHKDDASGVFALPKNGTGGYFNDYAYDKLCQTCEFTTEGNAVTAMRELQKNLREGSGVMLSVAFSGITGHALSCWGYVVDNDYDENNKAHYTRLLFSDSDSDMSGKNNRRTAPDKLRSMTLEPYEYQDEFLGVPYTTETWKCPDYGDCFLNDFSVLPSFDSASDCKETSLKATKNKQNTVDFVPNDFFVGQKEDTYEDVYVINAVPDNRDIYIAGQWMNLSEKYYAGDVKADLTVTDKNGNTVAKKTVASIPDDFEEGWDAYAESRTEIVNIGKLPAGTYTISMTANPDKTVSEAYYCNNTYTKEFTVSKALPNSDDISVTVSNPRADKGAVRYDLQFNGLTGEQRAAVTYCSVNAFIEENDENGESADELEPQFQNEGDIFPVAFRITNQFSHYVQVTLFFDGYPPLYLKSQRFNTDLPEISYCLNENEKITEDELSPVEPGAVSFANDESLNYTLWNSSSDSYDTVSGSYYLQARNLQTQEIIKLTNPVSFTLDKEDELEISITDFDTPLPQGEYELSFAIDSDCVCVYQGVECWFYIQAGKKIDPTNFSPGDVDLDGELTINDATKLQKYLADFITLDDQQLMLADVYRDNIIDINDVSMIQKKLVE